MKRRLWLFQVIVSGGYENRTICTLKQRPWLCFQWKNAITIKLGRVQSKRNWWTPAARMSAWHDKYSLSFANLLLQLLVVNNTSNANGLKVILHEKVQYNRLSRRSIGFFKYHQSATGFSTAMIVASHEFFLHIDVGLFENWFISRLFAHLGLSSFPLIRISANKKDVSRGESWTAWRVEIPGADAQKSWELLRSAICPARQEQGFGHQAGSSVGSRPAGPAGHERAPPRALAR